MKKYVQLSRKSVARLWDWAERNEGHPVAEAYMAYCLAVGSVMDLQESAYRNHAYMARDTFGRLVLDRVKSGDLPS